MKAVVSVLMSVGIALGGLLPGRALHDCAMTGKRDQPACCCKALAGACGSCALCDPGAGAAVREPAGPGDEAALRGVCCTVTHEKKVTGHAAPAGPEGAWKASLKDACRAPSLSVAVALPDLSGRSSRSASPSRPPGAGGAPLFILHCSLSL